jgi:restriction system protein
MCGDWVSTSLRSWLVEKFIKMINELPGTGRRDEAISWLGQAAEVLATAEGPLEKARHLDRVLGASQTVRQVVDMAGRALADYRALPLPGPLRTALPMGLLALPLAGGHGLGMAILGGLFGGPSLLLMFLGTAGIIAILDGVTAQGAPAGNSPPRRTEPGSLPRQRVLVDPRVAASHGLPRDEVQLRSALQDMNPFDFECHVMGFFARSGMEAWVTAKTNDMGVDGFARHPRGLIVVQCKRHSPGNLVGRPVVQQMKGVVAEQNALRGYLVTTSRFSDKARHSAKMSDQLVLVDIPELVRWHLEPPRLHA